MLKSVIIKIKGVLQHCTPLKTNLKSQAVPHHCGYSTVSTKPLSNLPSEKKRIDSLRGSREALLKDVEQYQATLKKVEQSSLNQPDSYAIAAIFSHYQMTEQHIEKVLSIINKTNKQV